MDANGVFGITWVRYVTSQIRGATRPEKW